MFRFEKSVIINCSLNKLFEFHTDLDNLSLLSKFKGMKVKLLQANLPVAKGSEIILKITNYGIISTEWQLLVTEFHPLNGFVDVMTKGPFQSWKHIHKFEEIGNSSKLTDIIKYEMPFGFAGKLFHKLFFKKMMNELFEYRHNLTKKLLET